MKFSKCILCLMLCVIMSASLLTACANKETPVIEPMEIEEAVNFSYDFIGGTDVMPIVGFNGPQKYTYSTKGQSIPESITDEFMQMVQECGINVISSNGADYATSPELTMKLLDFGEKYGIGIYAVDSLISNSYGEDALSLEELDERINNYVNHPACVGVYVKDEPSSDVYNKHDPHRMALYSPIFQNFKELDVATYGNLFRLNDLGMDLYEQYVQEFIDTCPTKFLSYDIYPFMENNSLENANLWFQNMSVIRSNAEEANIPFWTFVQAGSQWNDDKEHFDTNGYYPEEGSFYWLANTALAYGSKGIQYFPVLQPPHFAYTSTDELDFERNGLIGVWGNKNRWWYYAKQMNQQIAAVDEVLMNSVNKGVLLSGTSMDGHFDKVEYILEGTSWRELKDITGESMVGCFNYLGKSAFYVVNYDTEYAQKITLDLYDNYNMRVIQKAETSYVDTNSLTLTMNAGEGVLIVIEN